MNSSPSWRATKNAKYGVVIYSYEPKSSYPYLSLRFGDVVHILEENAGWYRGFSLHDKHTKGIFPASHICIKECNVINQGPDEQVVPKEDPLAHEIADVLREWNIVWKRLYAEGKRRQFQELAQLMRDLLDRRRQIISKTLPRDELKELKQLVGSKIDYGNRLLSLDLVPRDENGVPVNHKTAGVMQLHKLMKQVSQQQQTGEPVASINRKSYIHIGPTSGNAPVKDEHHLFVKFSALALPVNEPCELFFFIYDGRLSKVLSERYFISLSQHCLPKDPEKINQCFALFTDLDTSDLQNKDLYLACQVIRFGNYLEGKQTANPMRKPLGAAVEPLHKLLTAAPNSEHEEKDLQMEVFTSPPAEFYKLLDSIIKKQGIYHPTDKGTGVFVSLRTLRGPLDKVKEENPLLFRKFTAECHKLGFPEIIRPYDVRHDVYLTLCNGLFNKGTKRADKNVQVDVEVLNEADQVIEQSVIMPGIGEPTVKIYHSLVQYHCPTPYFHETIKLCIPPDMMKTTRIRFYMYHKPTTISNRLGRTEPFAISHLKLMKDDDTTIQDGTHELFVYKYKETSRGPFKYSTLPCINDPTTPQIVNSDMLCPRDYFFIKTQICSTKLTQNVDLHRLLNWRNNEERLPSILTAVTKVAGDEIVKFLADTFNALFAIMEEKVDTVGDLVFEALVFIIGLLAVEKYENFRPVLDTYCDKLFHASTVHAHLVTKMKNVFEQVMMVDGQRRMRGDIIQKTFKAAEFLIKFIMKSRALYDKSTRGKNSEQFLQSLRELLTAICQMMSLECKENELIAPRAQAQSLQFLPQTFDLFLSVMSIKSLGEIIALLLNNLKETKLKIYKSVFVGAVVSSELFKHKESRVIILPAILRHLCYHISNRDDLIDKCLDALGSIVSILHDQEADLVEEEVTTMVQTVLHVLLECFVNLSERIEKHTNTVGYCVSVIMAMFELMAPKHYHLLRNGLASGQIPNIDLEEFILCTFNAFCELAALNLYAADWTALKLLQNFVILRATNSLSQILVEDFLGPENDPVEFNPLLWQNFFELAVAFSCQSTLQLETLSEVKRNRILDSYGDMRIAMNSLMINKWNILGNYQSRYVPGMIGPFLKVSLIPHTAIRRATVPIFYDMMENEWKYKKNFHFMETEMIDKLDVFISGGMGDAKYRQQLYLMLTERCKNHPQMEREGGLAFIESLAELLRRLLDYRTVQQGDRDLHMHVMFNLLNFYKEMGREEIYIRYIYHLAQLHKDSGNWVEAGFTLLLHAQLLQWTSNMQKQEGQYPRQSSAERKEALYNDVIEYFDKGKLWECGIQQCKEIASQLETVTFNYDNLSKMHQTISRFYSNILREIRAEPEYFRVGFYGGFPPFLKNKVFIFRGHEYEKLSDFNARMSSQFPNAKFMKSLEPPGLDIMESSEQYIQSCSVEPVPERETMKKFEGKNVVESIIRFYHTNHVRRFMLKRPFHRGQKTKDNEYKTLHTECITYTTTYRFPGILRWFEVIDTDIVVKNPVENGMEMVLDNIQQLKTVISRIKGDSSHSTNPLTMKLNGTLDAAVNGGVSKFEVFFTDEYLDVNPKSRPLVPQLKTLMEELCQVCEDGVELHSQVRPDSMKGLHQRMVELLQDYSARYGSNKDSRDYDPVSFTGKTDPAHKRMSSNRRKEKLKERSMTVASGPGGRPPSFTGSVHLESLSPSAAAPPSRRDRAATTADMDHDSGKQRGHGSPVISPAHTQPPPPIPTHRVSDAPPPPLRKKNSASSISTSQTSLPSLNGSVGVNQTDGGDMPPPAPPRSTSVRNIINRKSGSSVDSRDASPTSTPRDGSTPVTPQREGAGDLMEQQSSASAGGNGSTDQLNSITPPPVPRKQKRILNQLSVQLQTAPPSDESTT